TKFWEKNGEVGNLWTELSTAMMDQNGRNGQEKEECKKLDNPSSEAACKYLHAGFEQLYDLTTPGTAATPSSSKDTKLLSNPLLRQTVGCFLLHAYAKHMKKNATCIIDKGIQKAFQSNTANCNGGTSGKGPCVPCQWQESDYDKCQINIKGSTTATETAKKKVEELVGGNEPNTESIIQNINKMEKLCDGLKCIASHLNSASGQKNASTFWTEGGEVANLWKQLSQAIIEKGKNGSGTDCNKMGDKNDRDATSPERKACQYLSAGFDKLKELTSTGATKINGNNILDKDLSFVKTMGCFLLHAYAKKMKGEAKCEIEAGIKKGFEVGNGLIKGVNCNDSSGKGPCVPCEWNEKILDSCEIKTNGGSGKTENTAVKDKLKQVQNKITETSTENLKNINITESLCEKLQCAAGKWFKNNSTTSNGNTTPTKNWCDFWEKESIKPELNSMFGQIESEGNETNALCNKFGDGNDDSVERKACNHITAGLKYIDDINPTVSGGSVNDQLLQRALGCIALNLYADQIIAKSEEKCPIDKEKINEMFHKWNQLYNKSCSTSGISVSGVRNNCFKCERNENFKNCNLLVDKDLIASSSQQNCNSSDKDNVQIQINELLEEKNTPKVKSTLSTINKMNTFCSRMQCAVKQYLKKIKNGKPPSWSEIKGVVESELKELLQNITDDEKWKDFDQYCKDDIQSNGDTPGEITAKKKACKLFALGLKHISEIKNKNKNNEDVVPLKRTMMCAALNLYADQLITKAEKQCPLDNKKLDQAIDHAFSKNTLIMNGGTSCNNQGNKSCFICNREKNTFDNCRIGQEKIKDKMEGLLEEKDNDNSKSNSTTPNMTKTLDKINEIESFCTQVQCAIKQKLNNEGKLPNGTPPSWSAIYNDAATELAELLKDMNDPTKQKNVDKYCDNHSKWNTLGHKEKHTNKAACLLFASGLQHIYGHVNDQKKGQFKGPSFGQTMGCLFLKEYAKQLKEMAKIQKEYKVHPNCSVDSGIEYAFSKSKSIMENATPPCDNNVPNSCFECKLDDYNQLRDCSIGKDKVGNKATELFTEPENKEHMEQTLENTVCPILLTDLLTPFLPLAPVSIGLSAMAYYLWKYFGPLGKGGARFRRSPAEIPGSSLQEQVLDHVEEAGPHEYQLVKERKPRSAPTRTKRSDRVNRRTIIEIHFEVLDECQKGDTQLNQKDFMELLVQEFMGSELMEEEQVPKEEVLIEGVPLEQVPIEEVPMERVPNLGSGFMV
ncbi:SICAvar, type I (fragment), partial [Plasmodium knowlesi strain H]